MTQNAWGVAAPTKGGAWADDVEDEEATHGAVLAPVKKDADDFPSLGMAAKVKETKRDKKKKQTMSLTDFMKSTGPGRPSDDDILMSLPTKPRERAPGEEPPSRLGGGFREFGGRGGSFRGRDDDEGPRRREREEDMGPSRAEMSDNWGKDRKFEPTGDRDRGYGGGFGGGFRDRDGSRERRGFDDGPSRADAEDRWGGGRGFVPSGPSRGGGGFDRGGEGDRYGPPRDRDSFREPSRADTESRWERRGDFQPTAFEDRPRGDRYDDRPRGDRYDDRPRSRGFGETWGGARDGSREPPRGFDRDGAGPSYDAPRERPRLNLAPRTAPVDKPAGGDAAAAPDAAAGGGGEAASAAKPAEPKAAKSNPFGAARPREEVLKEQGRDYRKEELQLEHKAAEVLREETEEERELAKEVESLRAKVEAGEADTPLDPSAGAEGKTVQAALDEAEERLARLQLELDDKVRYSRRQLDRGEGRDGPPRREDERGSSWGRREEGARGYSRERRFDSRDRREDWEEPRRGYEDRDRDRRDYGGRSYRDAPPPREASREGGARRW